METLLANVPTKSSTRCQRTQLVAPVTMSIPVVADAESVSIPTFHCAPFMLVATLIAVWEAEIQTTRPAANERLNTAAAPPIRSSPVVQLLTPTSTMTVSEKEHVPVPSNLMPVVLSATKTERRATSSTHLPVADTFR